MRSHDRANSATPGPCSPRSRTSTWTARSCTPSGPDGRNVDLPYDTLVVAAGATHSYFGKDEFAEFAPGMKTIEDARYLRDGILSKFEMAEMATDPARAGRVAHLRRHRRRPDRCRAGRPDRRAGPPVLPQEYRSVDTTRGADHPAGGRPGGAAPVRRRSCSATPSEHLEKMGVEIRVNTLAMDMDHESITVKGPDGVETIRTRTRIWAAGVQASPLARMLAEKTGAEIDRAGRVPVNPDCSLPGHPEVFAIGDMVSLNKLPGVAQPAMQEGKYVAKLIEARATGAARRRGPFKYFDKGSMATIGHKAAVADAFGMKVHRLPRLPHVGIHPRRVPDRLGQPARHPVQLGPRARGSARAAATASSPSNERWSHWTRTGKKGRAPVVLPDAVDPAAEPTQQSEQRTPFGLMYGPSCCSAEVSTLGCRWAQRSTVVAIGQIRVRTGTTEQEHTS